MCTDRIGFKNRLMSSGLKFPFFCYYVNFVLLVALYAQTGFPPSKKKKMAISNVRVIAFFISKGREKDSLLVFSQKS